MNVLKYIGYVVFFLISFVISLYLTFPWPAAKDWALLMASKQSGMDITAKTVEPDWVTGIEAKKVTIRSAKFEEPIELPELRARVHILPMLLGGRGGSVELPIAQGDMNAVMRDGSGETKIDAHVRGVQLALLPGLKDAIGVPLAGKLNLDATLRLDKAKAEGTSGLLRLGGAELELLKGGKIKGVTLPFEVAIGDFEWKVPIEAGKATLDKLKITGGAAEVELDGTINLNADIARSILNLTIKFKPTEAFLKEQPLVGAMLNNIRRAKGSDGFYAYALTGSIKHPRFNPKRGGR